MRCLISIFIAFFLFACVPSVGPPNLCDEPGRRCVSVPVADLVAVDGDTFELQRLTDRGPQRVRLRLIGWDAPEAGDAAACPQEAELGEQVEAAARALFASGQTITFLPEGADRFGRLRAHVYLDGQHIGYLLSRQGLAKEWLPGTVKPDWCG